MTQAYFIVPGLLVPNRNVLKAIPPEAIACVEKLTQGAEDWTEQTLAESIKQDRRTSFGVGAF